jgi:hypothetical protein
MLNARSAFSYDRCVTLSRRWKGPLSGSLISAVRPKLANAVEKFGLETSAVRVP